MTKADMIDKISEKVNGLTRRETEVIVNSVFDSIRDALARGDKVEIRGFGSFKLRDRRTREARNPKTGTPVSVPAKKVPFFKAGKELREIVDSR